MPLRAVLNGETIHAFDCQMDAWDALKKTYKKENLSMPCCGGHAVPKTSKHGIFFFAHKSGSECNGTPESPEHLYLKYVLAKAASAEGWSTTTEYRGCTPDGQEWIADVLCTKAEVTVALEAQLASTPYQEIIARTQRYSRSNVRAAWFVDTRKFREWRKYSNKKTPIFGINNIKLGEIPLLEQFNLPLLNFISALLSKKVIWQEEQWEYSILYINDSCWKCKKPIKQVYGSNIDVYGESAKTVPNASTVLSNLKRIIYNDELRALGLNTIGRHENIKGNAPGFPYCNECLYCGAPQNNHYLLKHIESGDRTAGEVLFKSPRESSGEWKMSSQEI